MSAAVEDELVEVRASEASRRIPVFGGRCAGQAGSDWLYVFTLQRPMTLADDVPLRIELLADGEMRAYPGQLVGTTAFDVTVSTPVKLPDKLPSVSLSTDPSFLLEQLLERLAELGEDASDLPLALFGFRQPELGAPAGDLDDDSANEFQLDALRAVLERDVTYVWGPPGTGKTTTLALIAEHLVRRGMRVLAVASTNVAVDNAVLKVAERLAGSGSVVRFGTPQLAALREPAGLAGATRGNLMQTMPLPFDTDVIPDSNLILSEAKDLASGPTGKILRGRAAQNDIGVTVVSPKRLPDPREEAARQRALRRAAVLGATLSRLALSPDVAASGFDAVLLDEASAAPLPSAFFAASLARAKVVALGDPKQLPPVALSSRPAARRWLQRDVFAQAGLDDDDPRAVLLREQYRMHPSIARVANELVYGGRLIDATRDGSHCEAVRLLDTSGEGGRCIRLDGSRQNELHAGLAIEAASQLLTEIESGPDERPVAIITPYRAQSRLIWRMLRDARLDRRVDVGTVHRFQGLERQAVVFDTVEAAPERPAPFLCGGYGSEAMRLINVAITRARSRLVLIANLDHLRRSLRRDSTLLGLLELVREGG